MALAEFPSYAEVYAYYMKNAKGEADAEILKHLEEIYMKPMEAIELTTLMESNFTQRMEVNFATQAWCNHDKDPNQNTKYIIKHLAFIDNFNLDISPLPERGLVVKNVSSGALLLDSNDSGSYYTVKFNSLKTNYMDMLQYYIENKQGVKQNKNAEAHTKGYRVVVKEKNNEYLFLIK